MNNFGFHRIASAIPSVRVADVKYNVEQIRLQVEQALEKGAEIICFPELCITGYTCQDLFLQPALLDESDKALDELQEWLSDKPVTVIVGAPVRQNNLLFNSAVVLSGGERFAVNKTYLPNYGEFYEQRWFAAEAQDAPSKVFVTPSGLRFAIEICEDLWAPVPPSSRHAVAGAEVIFNLSATNELLHKHLFLMRLARQQSERTLSAYVYSSCGFGESTQDLVYAGNALIFEAGEQLAASERFSMSPQLLIADVDIEKIRSMRLHNTSFRQSQNRELEVETIVLGGVSPAHDGSQVAFERTFNAFPMLPSQEGFDASCAEIFNIQVMGLVKRLAHTHCRNVVLGISGGLDSTLALLVCCKAFDRLHLDRKGIHGITMPGFGTTDRTYQNALAMMGTLGVSIREISIAKGVTRHFEDIGHDASVHDVIYENSQARYRTMLLMDIANQVGGLVIGTGDLSELALGWCTYNGDHMSMYAVNVGVAKTLVKWLITYVANASTSEETRSVLLDVVDTPISPELIPADSNGRILQKTEDLVGPYTLHDFFLYNYLRYGFSKDKLQFMAEHTFDGKEGRPFFDKEVIGKWLTTFFRRFYSAQFKRSCLPDGPKVQDISLSPRGDWRMPSDAINWQ